MITLEGPDLIRKARTMRPGELGLLSDGTIVQKMNNGMLAKAPLVSTAWLPNYSGWKPQNPNPPPPSPQGPQGPQQPAQPQPLSMPKPSMRPPPSIQMPEPSIRPKGDYSPTHIEAQHDGHKRSLWSGARVLYNNYRWQDGPWHPAAVPGKAHRATIAHRVMRDLARGERIHPSHAQQAHEHLEYLLRQDRPGGRTTRRPHWDARETQTLRRAQEALRGVRHLYLKSEDDSEPIRIGPEGRLVAPNFGLIYAAP